MSAFLGPIHFWLYDKIGNQEALTKAIAKTALEHGWITDSTPYIKTLPELESVIDESNIHGWLQTQIDDSETRYANLVNTVLASGGNMESLCYTARGFGYIHSLENNTEPEGAYRAFEDFFVNGMPCDRVNIVVSSDANSITWKQTQDIHAQYWTDGTENYYLMRNAVMEGMLLETELKLITSSNSYTLSK